MFRYDVYQQMQKALSTETGSPLSDLFAFGPIPEVTAKVGDQPDEPPVTFDGNIGTTASGEIWVTSDCAELPIPPYNYLIYGFGACKGVLTWCNSD